MCGLFARTLGALVRQIVWMGINLRTCTVCFLDEGVPFSWDAKFLVKNKAAFLVLFFDGKKKTPLCLVLNLHTWLVGLLVVLSGMISLKIYFIRFHMLFVPILPPDIQFPFSLHMIVSSQHNSLRMRGFLKGIIWALWMWLFLPFLLKEDTKQYHLWKALYAG